MYKNYNPAKCNICFTKGIKTKYTKFVYCKCKLVRYCSEEHRIEDLEVHEEICSKLQHIMAENKIDHILDINGSIKNQKKEFFEYVFVLLKTILNVNLERPLYHHEDTMISKPNICKVCFSHDQDTLVTCTKCYNVSYCKTKESDHMKEDAENHAKICNVYRIQYEMEPDFSSPCLMETTKTFKLGRLGKFPTNLFHLLSITNKNDYTIDPRTDSEFSNYMNVSKYSYVGTILYGLFSSKYALTVKNELVIHIVGAETEFDFFNRDACTVLLKWLPEIVNIILYFIGPELNHDRKAKVYEWKDCIRTVRKEFINSYYHNLNDEIAYPSMIVSFNCGFTEFALSDRDTWPESINCMMTFTDIPIVFTSYTYAEAIMDLGAVRNLQVDMKIVQKCLKNPFRDYRPLLNWEIGVEEIFYSNGYITTIIADKV